MNDDSQLIYQCGCVGTESYCPTHGCPPFGVYAADPKEPPVADDYHDLGGEG